MSSIPNSEILFIYEAKLCNPNGDPDEENRPRIDVKTGINLVSDVRLKRYFRDYIVNKFGEEYVWVSKVNGKHVSSDGRLGALNVKNPEDILKLCIDARLFGATIPIRAEAKGKRGISKAFIGPVQFSWGFSLHKVELVESSTITSIFVGREAEKEEEAYGTIGKDWRLYFSLIAFYGVISGKRVKGTGLEENDIKIFDNLLWKAVSLEPTTRSKIGEKPHLYIRVEYIDNDTIIGDLRKYIKTSQNEIVRNFGDVKLDFTNLIEVLKKYEGKISKIYVYCSDEMAEIYSLFEKVFPKIVYKLPHEFENLEKYLKK
jgi:CRISPR-associated protein Csh2